MMHVYILPCALYHEQNFSYTSWCADNSNADMADRYIRRQTSTPSGVSTLCPRKLGGRVSQVS